MRDEQLIKASRKKWLRKERTINVILKVFLFSPALLVLFMLVHFKASEYLGILVLIAFAATGFYGDKYKIEEKIEKLFYK
jgi:UDP-N-acetylmuramyl pentapeptide phosphotransferase/UDP-N-acetylglucosamine-1-phosphate transferase